MVVGRTAGATALAAALCGSPAFGAPAAPAARGPRWLSNPALQARLAEYWGGGRASAESRAPCEAPECAKPAKLYERFSATPPGVQWMDHGGYCGSWSIQRAALAKGVWVSQQQVRNHTVPGGGNDEEILGTNIDVALKNLKLKSEGFDYDHLPTPQADAYRAWMKSKLVAGHVVVWMIMLRGGKFPVYPGIPHGQYSHVEPVVGIMSDRPLNDTQWYDDDYVVHYTDADSNTYYRSMKSLPDDTSMSGNCASSFNYPASPCVYYKYGFGWAIEGVQDGRPGAPLSLMVEPSMSEPDTRVGEWPASLAGTVTMSQLLLGSEYAIYRWDSVADAFDYTKGRLVRRFTASASTEVFTDPVPIPSDSATYFRCVLAAPEILP